MAISASMVKELREMTGAGMMDCKKALTETDGNMEEAVELLRKSGAAKAEKKAGRIAAEGICRVAVDADKVAAVVEVNSETDFVAKNEVFQTYVESVAKQVVVSKAIDVEGLLGEKWIEDDSKTVKEALVEKVATIGENLNIRRFARVTADKGCVVTYLHGGGRIGVIVKAEFGTSTIDSTKAAAIKEALTNVAMQVAAMNPKYVSQNDVSEEYKAHEKEILMAQAQADPKNANKPEAIIEKMIIGRLNKELKEVCLLEQEYVKAENKESVAKYLEAVGKANGTDLKVTEFVRFETGEGLEKKNEDFAAEVAAQMNA